MASVLVGVTLGTATAVAQPPAAASPPPSGDLIIERHIAATMRDRVVLRADVYRPATPRRLPALLHRTPYSKHPGESESQYHRLARAGFVVVVQDTRGRYMSDGVAVPHDEGADGFDAIAWVAALPYVDGRVGMLGGSYGATTQLLAAAERPPALVALFPSASYASRHDMVFQGGAFYLADGLSWNVGQAMDVRRRQFEPAVVRDRPIALSAEQRRQLEEEWLWRLPLQAANPLDIRTHAPGYFDMLAHPGRDAWWDRFDVAMRHDRFEVPAYHLTGWYDALLNGTLANFTGLRAHAATDRARRNQRLIVGPWTHARPTRDTRRIGDVDFGPSAGFDAESLLVAWYRHWMGDAPATTDFAAPPVRLFVMGENRWRDEQEWPLARARAKPLHLVSDGLANSRFGRGRLVWSLGEGDAAGASVDTFTYDPRTPVPTGAAGAYSRAPTDQRTLEERRDVLVYTSEPMTTPLEVTGPVQLVLWAASSATDTDFTARLVDVHPDGTARALTDGILRARYRSSRTAPTLLTPGTPTEFVIEVGATSNVFLPGHRLRLEVSSSNFPRFDRNLNTGAPFGTDSVPVVARQTVFHDRLRASRLVLPVVPR
jgi:putative CocE/NonD family hydrolase